MLTRAQVILLAGLLLLAAAASLTYIASRAHSGRPLFSRKLRRLHAPRRTLVLLRRCLFLRADVPELDILHALAQQLTESLLHLRRDAAALPPLPGEDEPRIMAVARQAVSDGDLTAAALQRQLEAWQADGVTSEERLALPVCAAAALSERLTVTLRTLIEDEHGRRRASRLASQLCRSKRPMSLLTSRPLTLTELSALLVLLREQRQTLLLELIAEWLAGHGADAEDIADRYARRQTAIADDLHAAASQLSALRLLDWPGAAEDVDPLHQLLLKDPSGIYPRMTLPSRQLLRIRAERIARWFHVGAEALVAAALQLCEQAEGQSLERHVGFYLLESAGISALRVQLALRRGRIRTFAAAHCLHVRRSILWIFSVISAIFFLNDGNPLFMLPPFLIVLGSVPRAVLSRFSKAKPLPAMEISAVTDELRTLVVLPAELADASDALRRLRYLRTVQSAFPADGVDYLLLGDYTSAMTQRSSSDAAIIAAAAQGAAALCEKPGSGRIMYMQRSRIWLPEQHTYGARGGASGAIESVCRLIAQGECEDYLDHATFSPASLHRSYAFVLLLDGDSRPAPGLLEALLRAAAHPLNMRYPLPEGMRGSSCFASCADAMDSLNDEYRDSRGIRLIRPDAVLEALDGVLSPEAEDDGGFLSDALSGTAIIPEAHAYRDAVTGILRTAQARCQRAYRRCRILHWLLPWVNTPSGIIRNPLPADARFALRERLRASLMPVFRCVLLLWALLERNVFLLLIALFLPDAAGMAAHGRRWLWQGVQNSILLPLHASAAVYAAFRALLPLFSRQNIPSLRELENWHGFQLWTQCVASIVCFLLGVAIPPLWPPAILPAAAFALYPLLHLHERRKLAPVQQLLPTSDEPALRRIAEATWHYFRHCADVSRSALPPAWIQHEPAVTIPAETTPESAGMYLMAIVSAKELGLIDVREASERIRAALDAIQALPLRHGLPCRRYSLPSLSVSDAVVDARSCGILITALMTAAQAMRTWLPELSPECREIPAALDALADSYDLTRLYDPAARLFYLTLDQEGVGEGHALYFSDTSILLSVAACSRGLVPPEHFAHLSRTCTEAGSEKLPLSASGDLAAYLLPGLFLPLDATAADRLVWLHQSHGSKGLWGRSESAEYAFTPELHYRRSVFGLREISSGEPSDRPVFAPYAAALALTCTPSAALRCLHAMQQLGAFGLHGFPDSVDMSSGVPQIVQMQDTFHQGLILCAAAHVLADAPLRRYFCGLPHVESCLPLLQSTGAAPLLLSPRPMHNRKAAVRSMTDRPANAGCTPIDAHLIGSRDASLIMNAFGSSCMLSGDVPLTCFAGDPRAIEGMQIYIVSRGRVFRLSDPTLPGETTFGSGCIRIERLCGSLRARLTILTDPAAGRFLHLLEVANLSTSDCRFEAADLLPADLNTTPETLEADRPDAQQLVLRNRTDGRAIYHHISISVRTSQMTVCTDSASFLGRGRTLADPASLEEPMSNLYTSSCADCLSFRAALKMGGRATARILFTTSTSSMPPPQWQELNGLVSVAELHARAVADAIPISSDALMAASRMTGALLWHGQPHQGTHAPLDASLAETLLHAKTPILTVVVPDDAALPLLRECLAVAAWFSLHGQHVTLYILCSASSVVHAEKIVSSCLLPEGSDAVRLLTDVSPMLQEALFAVSSIVIHGDCGSLSSQLDALCRPIHVPDRQPPPAPGYLPDMELENPGGYGGFDPDSGDYIIQLGSQQTTPIPWVYSLKGSDFAFTADETGFFKPFDEQLMLSLDGGVPFHPLRVGLPMTVRVGFGSIRWRVFAEDFTLTLDAAPMAGLAAGLRSVRLRNHRKEEMSVMLTVSAGLSTSPTQHLSAVNDAVLAHGGDSGFLAAAEGDWSADTPDTIDLPTRHRGSTAARLSLSMTIAPGLSGGAAWLCGHSRAADDVAAAQQAVRQRGVSASLRAAVEDAVTLLPSISVSTPEPTLDLLVNHVLPRQVICAGLSLSSAAIIPQEDVRSRLMKAVHSTPDNSVLPVLLSALYMHMTGDSAILDMPVADADTLMGRCRAAIAAYRVERDAADLSHAQLREALLAAAAAGVILSFCDDEELREHRRSIINAADTYFWHKDHYGEEERLTLDIQASAALAMGSTPRTRRCLRTAWETLYDRENGLIRQQLPTDAAPCPGTMHNGGHETASAVLFLAALAALHENDKAWELLRAINPLHHTDDPVRSENFAGPPWLLPEGMQAAPAKAGRACGSDAASADLLLTIILTCMLGLRWRDGRLDMLPRVPDDWDSFSLTLAFGASTWRIDMERSVNTPMRDGIELSDGSAELYDDGRVHQLRLPLR